MPVSTMDERTRSALARYSAVSLNISFTSDCVTMMSDAASVVSATALRNKYTMRFRFPSALWKSFVTPKKTPSASGPEKDSPCAMKYSRRVICWQHRFGCMRTKLAS